MYFVFKRQLSFSQVPQQLLNPVEYRRTAEQPTFCPCGFQTSQIVPDAVNEAYSRKQEHSYTGEKKTGRSIHGPRLSTDIDYRRPILRPPATTYSCQLCGEAQSPTRVAENPFPLPSCWCFLAPVQNHWGEILLILMACSPLTYCLDLSQQKKKSKSMDSKLNSFLRTPGLELSTQEGLQPTE